MTDTTPDHAGLIERLHKEAARHASYDDISREGALLAEAAAAIRTLLERHAALERELEMWREVKHSSCWKARAEAAEARVKELEAAIKVKGGTEHAPTEWAYLKVCEIADKYKARAEAAEAKLAEAMKELKSIEEKSAQTAYGSDYIICHTCAETFEQAHKFLKENGNGE